MITDTGTSDIIVKPNGDKITRKSIVNEGEQFYEEVYQNKLSEICDFSEGSEIRTLHESFAVEVFSLYKELYRMAKMKFVLDSEGTYLDRLACEHHLNRRQGSVATGTVTFSTDESLFADYIIPAGTVLLSKTTGYEYVLEENVTISNSAIPVNGLVHSKLTGYRYNVAEKDRITVFQEPDRFLRSVKVTNHSPITGGADRESDVSLRSRILNSKKEKSWGTVSMYNNLLKEEVVGVHDVQFVDPKLLVTSEYYPPHLKNNSTVNTLLEKIKNGEQVTFDELKPHYCTDCTRVLFVNGFNKPIDSITLENVNYVITRQNNLVVGQLFHVQAADVLPIYFKIELFCSADVSESVIYDHLTTYMDGGIIETKRGDVEYTGLNIGETLYKKDLIEVLENVPGIEQVGEFHLLKFNPEISSINWIDNDNGTYSYTDEDGYIYTKTKENSTMSSWGEQNFVEINIKAGQVLQCGKLSWEDESRNDIFLLDKHIVTS